jgi:hypothetical protein
MNTIDVSTRSTVGPSAKENEIIIACESDSTGKSDSRVISYRKRDRYRSYRQP